MQDTATAHERRLSTSLPGLNIAGGLSRIRGNRQLYGEILKIYQGLIWSKLEDLKACVDRGDYEEAKAITHSLKGSSGSIGAETVLEIASRIQDLFNRKADRSVCLKALETLETEIERVQDSIEIYQKLQENE